MNFVFVLTSIKLWLSVPVETGLGISVVPALPLFNFQRTALVTRALKIAGLKRCIYVVQREEERLSVAAQALRSLIVKQFAQTRNVLG